MPRQAGSAEQAYAHRMLVLAAGGKIGGATLEPSPLYGVRFLTVGTPSQREALKSSYRKYPRSFIVAARRSGTGPPRTIPLKLRQEDLCETNSMEL
jgi:hypothetical protein